MNDIIYESAKVLAKSDLDNVMLLQLIIDPYMYVNKRDKEKTKRDITLHIEPHCRRLCYHLHQERYKLLDGKYKKK